jgi:hypothetical protein
MGTAQHQYMSQCMTTGHNTYRCQLLVLPLPAAAADATAPAAAAAAQNLKVLSVSMHQWNLFSRLLLNTFSIGT